MSEGIGLPIAQLSAKRAAAHYPLRRFRPGPEPDEVLRLGSGQSQAHDRSRTVAIHPICEIIALTSMVGMVDTVIAIAVSRARRSWRITLLRCLHIDSARP